MPILIEVESLARKQGLRVGRQSFEREDVKGLPVERFGIMMPVEGDLQAGHGPRGRARGSPTFVTLDKMSATDRGVRRRGGSEQVGLDLEFSAYFRAGAERGPAMTRLRESGFTYLEMMATAAS